GADGHRLAVDVTGARRPEPEDQHENRHQREQSFHEARSIESRESSRVESQIWSPAGGGCALPSACVPALTDHSKKSAPKAIPISQIPVSDAMN
ncbi:hypothetical protein G3I15_22695, partial [Streptomyces sp. SID10244]|nr:hypothetical protein [Streptomyces sp. SID10244]